VKPSGRRYSKRVGVLLGIGLLVVIGAMVYPFRAHDYELQLLLVLPGLPGAEARTVAERVRAAMQAGGRHRVAVAGGVAELETDEQFSTVVSRARAKVAQARVRGNNRVS